MNYICVDGVGSLLEELLYCSEEKFEGIIKWTMVPNRAAWLFHRSWNGAINLREERWSCPKNIHCYRTRGVFLSREKFQTSGWNVTRTEYDRNSFDKEANVTLWSGYNDLQISDYVVFLFRIDVYESRGWFCRMALKTPWCWEWDECIRQ